MILLIAIAVLKQGKIYEAKMMCYLLTRKQNANLWHIIQT